MQDTPGSTAPRTMLDVHVQPDGAQAWVIRGGVGAAAAGRQVTASRLGAYRPASHEFFDVLDTTGALAKRILFPGRERVLYVAQLGRERDVFVTLDAAARRPLAQRSYPGDRGEFRLSPSGRALLAIDRTDQRLHLLDTASLADQIVPGGSDRDPVVWATREDVLYRLKLRGGSTEVQRFDLRGADLGRPLPPPSVVATLPGVGDWPAVAADDRFLALAIDPGTSASRIAMIDLAAATTRTVAGDVAPGFTGDDRVVVWQRRPDDTHELRIVDPRTGGSTAPVATELVFPVGIPLRHHELVLATSTLFEPAAFLYRLADGARSPVADLSYMTSRCEHPRRAELWMWFEYDGTLRRLDLATGAISAVVEGVDSADYRPGADEIVIGTRDHALRRLSMATAQPVGPPLVLGDPTGPAPHRLIAG